MSWNRDISQAPRGRHVMTTVYPKGKDPHVVEHFFPDRVILATKCGKRVMSQWLPEGKERKVGRWQMLNEGEEPVAWYPWPAYPHAL